MNVMYLIGALVVLLILGYPFILLVIANGERGVTRIFGQILSALFMLTLVSLIILYQTGIAQMPKFRLMPDKPTTRMRRGISGYLTGMMLEDERVIGEFINGLRTNSELYERFKEELKE